jgi:glyoxylase-like metal-dependent hydrolase (beta-lactamase superfamily II)
MSPVCFFCIIYCRINMPEEIFPNLFREQIPLPKSPLRAVNSYVIKGDGRWLIVDTGMNRPECLEAMKAYLAALNVDLARTDFFITHLHVDHLGLVSELCTKSSNVYFNFPDNEGLHDPHYWETRKNAAFVNGFPEADIGLAVSGNPGFKYQTRLTFETTLLKEGDTLACGDYSFRCVETPGHTRGHLCLYEPMKKIFFSGDHILPGITPNISLWSENGDPLQSYLASLDKVLPYDISIILPGHREPFTDHRRRINELQKHHEERCMEILTILKKGKQSAYHVASKMTWGIRCRRWEEFPLPQKWFAGGEAMAHLHYLKGLGRVKKEYEDGKAFFLLVA